MATNLAVGSKLTLTMVCQDPTTFQVGEMVWAARVATITAGVLSDQDVVDVIDALTAGPAKVCLADDVAYFGWIGRVRDVIPPPVAVTNFTSNGPGVVGGTTSPGQLACLGTLRTNVGGPTGHGRKYFPFVPKLYVDENNECTAAALINYIAFWGLFVFPVVIAGAAGAGTIEFGVTNRLFTHFYPLTQIQSHLGIATQRRRGYYGKQNALLG